MKERIEDIPYLIPHFLKGKKDKPFESIDLSVLFSIVFFDWEGNVRELKRYLHMTEMAREVWLKEKDKISIPNWDSVLGVYYLRPPLNRDFKNAVRLNEIRQKTNFDEILLNQYQNDIRKSEGPPNALYLDLNENFPGIAPQIVLKFKFLFDGENTEEEGWKYNIENLKDINENEYEEAIGLGIKLKDEYLSYEREEKTVENELEALFDLTFEEAKKKFEETYIQQISEKNPGLTKTQLAAKLGIDRRTLTRKMGRKVPKK